MTKYNRLTLIEEIEPYIWGNKKYKKFLCKCDCGTMVEVRLDKMKLGNTKSCGCYNKELITKPHKPTNLTHGHTKKGNVSREFHSWHGMKQRCTNPKTKHYNYYGGRGITICDRWLNSFTDFIEDMGPRPEGKSLDRINNDGNYEPNNCKWSTQVEQLKNRRINA